MDKRVRETTLRTVIATVDEISLYTRGTFGQLFLSGIGRIKSDVIVIKWDTFLQNQRLPHFLGWEFFLTLCRQFSRISMLLSGLFRLQFLKERDVLPAEQERYLKYFSEPDTLENLYKVCHHILELFFGEGAITSLGAYPDFFGAVFQQGEKHFSVIDLTRAQRFSSFIPNEFPDFDFAMLPTVLKGEPRFFGRCFDLDIPSLGAFRYQASPTSERCLLVNPRILFNYLAKYWDITDLRRNPHAGKSPWFKCVYWRYLIECGHNEDLALNAFRNRYLDVSRFETDVSSLAGIKQALGAQFPPGYDESWCLLFGYQKIMDWLQKDCVRLEKVRKAPGTAAYARVPRHKTLAYSTQLSFPSLYIKGQVFLGFEYDKMPPFFEAIKDSPFYKHDVRKHGFDGLVFFASRIISSHLDDLPLGRTPGFQEWIYRVDSWTRDEYRKNIGIRVTKKFTYDQDAAILGLYHPCMTKDRKQLIISRCGGRSWKSIVQRARVLRKQKIAAGVFDPGLIPHTNYNVELNRRLKENEEKLLDGL